MSKLAEAIDPSADLDFDYLGIQTLYDRYLVVDKTGEFPIRLETPQIFWMRLQWVYLHMRKILKIKLYLCTICTKAGVFVHPHLRSLIPEPHSQLSSCYLYKVDDTIESIMYRGIAENAFLSKWAGGLGGSWTSVRGTGSHIAGTNGESVESFHFSKCTMISYVQ